MSRAQRWKLNDRFPSDKTGRFHPCIMSALLEEDESWFSSTYHFAKSPFFLLLTPSLNEPHPIFQSKLHENIYFKNFVEMVAGSGADEGEV